MLLLVCLLLCGYVVDGQTDTSVQEYDHGAMSALYSIGYGISMSFVPEEGIDSLTNLVHSFYKNYDAAYVRKDSRKFRENKLDTEIYKPISVLCGIGLLFAVAISIVMCVIASIRGCCCCSGPCGGKKNQKVDSSPRLLYISLGVLVVSFVFILPSTVLFGVSLDQAKNTTEYEVTKEARNTDRDLGKLVDHTYKVLEQSFGEKGFLESLGQMKKTLDELTDVDDSQKISEIEYVIEDDIIPRILETLDLALTQLSRVGTAEAAKEREEISQLVTATKEIGAAAMPNGVSLLSKDATEAVGKELKDVLRGFTVNLNVKKLTVSFLSVGVMIEDSLVGIDNIRTATQYGLRKLATIREYLVDQTYNDRRHHQMDDKDKSGAFPLGGLLTVVLATTHSTLGLFVFVVALILIVGGVVGAGLRIRNLTTLPYERSEPSNVGAILLLIGSYAIFVLGTIALVNCVTIFAGSVKMTAGCRTLFLSPLEVVGREEFEETTPLFDVGYFLKHCESSSVFTALGGHKHINREIILRKANFDEHKAALLASIDTIDIPHTVIESYLSLLKAQHTEYKRATSAFVGQKHGPAQAKPALDDARSLIVNLLNRIGKQSRSTHSFYLSEVKRGQKILREKIENTISGLNTTMINLVDVFMRNITDSKKTPCGQVVVHYKKLGALMCDKVGRPVNGAWVAMGLGSLFFLPSALALLYVTRWLFRMDKKYYNIVQPAPNNEVDAKSKQTQSESSKKPKDPSSLSATKGKTMQTQSGSSKKSTKTQSSSRAANENGSQKESSRKASK